MASSHVSAAAAGFLAAPLLSSVLLIYLGEGGLTVPFWLNACLMVAGMMVAGAARASRPKPARRTRIRPTRIVPEHLSDRMRRDLGLDNL